MIGLGQNHNNRWNTTYRRPPWYQQMKTPSLPSWISLEIKGITKVPLVKKYVYHTCFEGDIGNPCPCRSMKFNPSTQDEASIVKGSDAGSSQFLLYGRAATLTISHLAKFPTCIATGHASFYIYMYIYTRILCDIMCVYSHGILIPDLGQHTLDGKSWSAFQTTIVSICVVVGN